MEIKKTFKKFWNLLWKDDSLKGWIFSVIFLFIFIKFIFFPILSLATGTALPLAIVESCSMYHQSFSSYNNWWEKHEGKYSEFEIPKTQFKNFVLKKGFNKGDILFIIKAKPEKLKVGDIIIFEAGRTNPLIHRIINIKETSEGKIFSTIGDNNNGQLSLETSISEDQLVGKAVLKIAPLAGWAKLIFYESKRQEYEKGFCEEN